MRGCDACSCRSPQHNAACPISKADANTTRCQRPAGRINANFKILNCCCAVDFGGRDNFKIAHDRAQPGNGNVTVTDGQFAACQIIGKGHLAIRSCYTGAHGFIQGAAQCVDRHFGRCANADITAKTIQTRGTLCDQGKARRGRRDASHISGNVTRDDQTKACVFDCDSSVVGANKHINICRAQLKKVLGGLHRAGQGDINIRQNAARQCAFGFEIELRALAINSDQFDCVVSNAGHQAISAS